MQKMGKRDVAYTSDTLNAYEYRYGQELNISSVVLDLQKVLSIPIPSYFMHVKSVW